MEDFIQDIIDDLTTELQETDDNFSLTLLTSKVNSATKEVKKARRYPSTYTDAMIVADIEQFYMNIRNIALYDYNMVGAEFQTSSSENSVSRNWVDRSSLFDGVVPFAKI